MPRKQAPRTKSEVSEIEILELETGVIDFALVGTTPFICNRMSEKARREILSPRKKTASEKAQTYKHHPFEEFRASPYTLPEDDAPTLIAFVASAVKKAMMNAALDMPGAYKSQIGRLVRVEGERIPMYGVPQLLMSVTRSADIKRTPDIRSRAILPQWATFARIRYAKPMLREKGIINLLAGAGVLAGLGDWRVEKGSGDYGTFRLASADDPELKELMRLGDRKAQVAAMNSPETYDRETEELLEWWIQEMQNRGFKVAL